MNDALLPLIVCVVTGLLWYDALRAREIAIAHARQLCAEHDAQMLDQGVALHRLRLRWRGKLHLERGYRFEVSYAGNDRHRASLTLIGNRMVDYSLPTTDEVMAGANTSTMPSSRALLPTDSSDNVAPIARGQRTLH